MEKVIKIFSLIIALSLIFSSCNFDKSDKDLNKAIDLIESKEYNECREYLESLDKETLNEIYGPVSEKVIEIYSQQSLPANITDITQISTSLTSLCRSLFSIIKVLPANVLNNNNDIKNICYYSFMDDLMRYKELYSLLSDMNQHNFFSSIDNALQKYDEDNDYSYFYEAYNIISSYSSSQFDQNKFQVSECKQTTDKLKASIKNAITALEANNSKNIVTAVNDIYNVLDDITTYINIAKSVKSKTEEIYNISHNNISAYKDINTDLEYKEGTYSFDTINIINSLFGKNDDNSTSNIDEDELRDLTSTIDVDELITTIKSAIISTKKYSDTVLVQHKTENKIVFLNYDDSLFVDKSKNLNKGDIEEIISEYNKSDIDSKTFKNCKSDEYKLSDFVPPSYGDFDLSSQDIKTYSVMQGSSGYKISITLDSMKSNSSRTSKSIKNIINPFCLDTDKVVDSYSTYYKQTLVTYIINNNNRFTEIEYTLSGTNTSKFSDGSDFVTCDFSFESDNKFTYTY